MTDLRTDEQLLGSFAQGHEEALGLLAARYEGAMVGLARGLLGGREDAARDVVQDVWVRVIKSAKHFGGRSAVKTWLYRIVVNRCHDARRESAKLSLNGSVQRYPTSDAEPEAALHAEESKDRLRVALEGMDGDARLLLLLCYHEGLSHTEAADVLGVPVGTLKSRLHKALERLRGVMASEMTP